MSTHEVKVIRIQEVKKHPDAGIVIKPLIERVDHRLGRVALKRVSNWYLSR